MGCVAQVLVFECCFVFFFSFGEATCGSHSLGRFFFALSWSALCFMSSRLCFSFRVAENFASAPSVVFLAWRSNHKLGRSAHAGSSQGVLSQWTRYVSHSIQLEVSPHCLPVYSICAHDSPSPEFSNVEKVPGPCFPQACQSQV